MTPFCSCSAVPAFIGFVAAGVPLGVTLSFLIASPLVNEVAIVLLFGLFGWKITALYIVGGMVIAIVAGGCSDGCGWSAGSSRSSSRPAFAARSSTPPSGLSWDDRIGWAAKRSPRSCTRSGRTSWSGSGSAPSSTAGSPPTGSPPRRPAGWGVPLAVVIGVPLYSNAAGVLPLVEALHDKGLPMGTVLAFMMSVVALSPPEMILLRRVLKPKLIATYFGVVAVSILLIGFLFNLVI